MVTRYKYFVIKLRCKLPPKNVTWQLQNHLKEYWITSNGLISNL